MDRQLLENLRSDSLSKHDGATRKYAGMSLDTCKQVILNRKLIDGGEVMQAVFEEHDGWGHGINFPKEWYLEGHIIDRTTCPRCGGAGKLAIGDVDCNECNGTGKIVVAH